MKAQHEQVNEPWLADKVTVHCSRGDKARIKRHAEHARTNLSTVVMESVHRHLHYVETSAHRRVDVEAVLSTAARVARTRKITHGDFLALACRAYESLVDPALACTADGELGWRLGYTPRRNQGELRSKKKSTRRPTKR